MQEGDLLTIANGIVNFGSADGFLDALEQRHQFVCREICSAASLSSQVKSRNGAREMSDIDGCASRLAARESGDERVNLYMENEGTYANSY